MITENNQSVFHCDVDTCRKFLSNVSAICVGPPGDERIVAVHGDCKVHGDVETHTTWDYEEFFPDDEPYL